jgi:hypothetical protein
VIQGKTYRDGVHVDGVHISPHVLSINTRRRATRRRPEGGESLGIGLAVRALHMEGDLLSRIYIDCTRVFAPTAGKGPTVGKLDYGLFSLRAPLAPGGRSRTSNPSIETGVHRRGVLGDGCRAERAGEKRRRLADSWRSCSAPSAPPRATERFAARAASSTSELGWGCCKGEPKPSRKKHHELPGPIPLFLDPPCRPACLSSFTVPLFPVILLAYHDPPKRTHTSCVPPFPGCGTPCAGRSDAEKFRTAVGGKSIWRAGLASPPNLTLASSYARLSLSAARATGKLPDATPP